jgi:hypothetical protein
MKDTVQEIFDKLGQSEPVFVGEIRDGDLVFVLKNEYDPKTADVDHSDPVANLVVSNYRESFDKHGKCFTKSDRAIEIAQREVFNFVKRAFVQASPLKNPQQSKLYKWFEFGKINSLERRQGLIALYRYVNAHIDKRTSRFDGGPDSVHAKNLVAILEKMKEKYEQQKR